MTIVPHALDKPPLLEVTDLHIAVDKKGLSTPLVSGVSFSLRHNQTLCIVGESGSGKSLTAQALMRLLDPQLFSVTGTILFNGQPLLSLSERDMRPLRGKQVAMIFQEPMKAFDPVYTIGSQIMEVIRKHDGLSRPAALAKTRKLLADVRMSDIDLRIDQYPHELSGGMLQRAMIAMALSCDPLLLIADEPTTALDVTIQAQILELLAEIKQQRQMSILFITHDLDVAAQISDATLVMYQGEVVERDDTGRIYHTPEHPYTQKLLGALIPMDSAIGSSLGGAAVAGLPATQPAPVTPSDALFTVNNVSRWFDSRHSRGKPIKAVNDISFSIRHGESFGLIGESGSGKSTLGRLLTGLEKPTAGHILFKGQDIALADRKQQMAFRKNAQIVFQNPYDAMNWKWTVRDIIGEPLKLQRKMHNGELSERVQELLQEVGLNPDSLHRYPRSFSGGQRQRISIARAIALNPQFILADEAVSALDVSVQTQIVNLLISLREKYGLSYLFIGHGLNVVRHLSDRIGVMYLGKLVEVAPSNELFSHPAHHYTRALASANPGRAAGHSGLPLSGEIPSPTQLPDGCVFHTRCPAAIAQCAREAPELRLIASDRWAACHFPL